jgi:hypothetical protein
MRCGCAPVRSTRRSEMQRQPTLLSSCARATTAAEAGYRISYAFAHRSSRVIALDEQSAAIVRNMAGRLWGGGHFLVFDSALPDEDALLRRVPGQDDPETGGTALLSEELATADTVVMVAAAEGSAEAASVIGDAAAARGIMSAGLVVPGETPANETPGETPGGSLDGIVSALRPNAMVLVVLREAGDLPEVLSALRV